MSDLEYKNRKIYDEHGTRELTQEEKERRFAANTRADALLDLKDTERTKITTTKDHAQDFYKSYWNKEVQVEEWSDDDILKELKDARRSVNMKAKISMTEKSKRITNFRNRVRTQKALYSELERMTKDRKNALTDAGISTVQLHAQDEQQDKAIDRFDSETATIAMNWVPFLQSRFEADKAEKAAGNRQKPTLAPGEVYKNLMSDDQSRGFMMLDMLTYIQDADMTQFAYRDDASFIAGFAKKYEALKAFADGEKIVEFLKTTNNGKFVYVSKNGQREEANADKEVILAKSALAKELLADYEGRMRIIQSPYYALFAGKDFEKLSKQRIESMKKIGDEDDAKTTALNEYLDFVIAWKEKKAGTFKKADINLKLDEKLTQVRQQESAEATAQEKARVKDSEELYGELDALIAEMATDKKRASAYNKVRAQMKLYREALDADSKREHLGHLAAAVDTYLIERREGSYEHRLNYCNRFKELYGEYTAQYAKEKQEQDEADQKHALRSEELKTTAEKNLEKAKKGRLKMEADEAKKALEEKEKYRLTAILNPILVDYDRLNAPEVKAEEIVKNRADILKFMKDILGEKEIAKFNHVPTEYLKQALVRVFDQAGRENFKDDLKQAVTSISDTASRDEGDVLSNTLTGLLSKKEEEMTEKEKSDLKQNALWVFREYLDDETFDEKAYDQIPLQELGEIARQVLIADRCIPEEDKKETWENIEKEQIEKSVAANAKSLAIALHADEELLKLIPAEKLNDHAYSILSSFSDRKKFKELGDACIKDATDIKERIDAISDALQKGSRADLVAAIKKLTGSDATLQEATTEECVQMATKMLKDVADPEVLLKNHKALAKEITEKHTEEGFRQQFIENHTYNLAAELRENDPDVKKRVTRDPKRQTAERDCGVLYLKKALQLSKYPESLENLSDDDLYKLVTNVGIIKSLTQTTDPEGNVKTVHRYQMDKYDVADYDKAFGAIHEVAVDESVKKAIKDVLKQEFVPVKMFAEKDTSDPSDVTIDFYNHIYSDPLPTDPLYKEIQTEIWEENKDLQKQYITQEEFDKKKAEKAFAKKNGEKKKKAVKEEQAVNRIIEEEASSEEWDANTSEEKNMLADLIFETAGGTADTLKKALTANSGILAHMVNHTFNPEFKGRDVFATLTSGTQKGERALVRSVERAFQIVADAIVEKARQDPKNANAKVIYPNVIFDYLKDDALANVFEEAAGKLEDGIAKAEEEILKTMDTASDTVFDQIEGQGLPNIFDTDTKQSGQLLDYMQNNLRYDESRGQGKFIRTLIRDYYREANKEDRRFMLSFIFRDMKKNEKGITEGQKGGHLFASVLKGAGPLMQKMMQGVPEDIIVPNLREGINVVKSDLRPIDPKYVDSVLEKIRTNPDNKLKSIQKIRSLGAASVAETFLCEITDKKGNKQEVVVKIKRPDVEARMQRELTFIRKAAMFADMTEDEVKTYKAEEKDKNVLAKHTPKVTESGFLAQYSEIKKEFDFLNEVNNCETGVKEYTNEKHHVKSVQINKQIVATSDYFVMDKAEGTTLDRFIRSERDANGSVLKRYKNTTKGTRQKHTVTAANINKINDDMQEMNDRIFKDVKAAKDVGELTHVWISKALFGSDIKKLKFTNFHHGDLHAGNIMVNGKGTTVLDYGNATVLSNDKVKQILRMMTSVVIGKPEFFVEAFSKMIDIEIKEEKDKKDKVGLKPLSAAKKKQFKDKLTEIFRIGTAADSGKKIMLALTAAQEIGIKLPLEIQNFSQCQQRLENSVNEIRQSAIDTKRTMDELERMPVDKSEDESFDPMIHVQRAMCQKGPDGYLYANRKKAAEAVIDNYLVNGNTYTLAQRTDALTDEKDEKVINQVIAEGTPYYKDLVMACTDKVTFAKRVGKWRNAFEEAKKSKAAGTELSADVKKVLEGDMAGFIDQAVKDTRVFQYLIADDEVMELKQKVIVGGDYSAGAIEKLMLIFEHRIPKLFDEHERLTEFVHKCRVKDVPASKEEQRKINKEMTDHLTYLTGNLSNYKPEVARFRKALLSSDPESLTKLDKNLAGFFERNPYVRDTLDAVIKSRKKYAAAGDDVKQEELIKLQNEYDDNVAFFMLNFIQTMQTDLSSPGFVPSDKDYTLDELTKPGVASEDFNGVMGDVIEKNLITAGWRLGTKYKVELDHLQARSTFEEKSKKADEELKEMTEEIAKLQTEIEEAKTEEEMKDKEEKKAEMIADKTKKEAEQDKLRRDYEKVQKDYQKKLDKALKEEEEEIRKEEAEEAKKINEEKEAEAKRLKEQEAKRKKEEEKKQKEEQKRRKEEEEQKRKQEEKRRKEEQKRLKEEEKKRKAEEKKKKKK